MSVATMLTPAVPVQSVEGKLVPPLEQGDRLDQPTFHERYVAMGPGVKAELIGGEVYMASPVGQVHADEHARLNAVLCLYEFGTPGVRVSDNPSVILGDDAEPQPDGVLHRLAGGRTRIVQRGDTTYLAGPPELVAEVASSTESIDLHRKRHDYEQYDVGEYLLVLVRTRAVIWFVREGGRFVEMPADADGVLRSRRFPGLWLDPAAFLSGDTARLKAVVDAGLASAEHAAFVASLAG